MSGIGRRLYETNFGAANLATEDDVRELIDRASAKVEGHRFNLHFLWTEWSQVVDAWQLESWEDYRDVMRLGRKTRVAETQRAVLWSIFSQVRGRPGRTGAAHRVPACSGIWSGTSRRERIRRSSSASSTRHRTSAWRSCASSRRSAVIAPTACSSPAISASASSGRPSPGARWAWTCAGAPTPCASTTGPPTRYGGRRIACCRPSSPTWTASRSGAVAPSPRSMGRSPTSAYSHHRRRRPLPSPSGSPRADRKASRRTRSLCLSDPRTRSRGHRKPFARLA